MRRWPVFDSIVFTAVRLLRCDLAFVLLCDGATYSPAAVASPEGPHADVGPTNLPIDRSANFPSRPILDKKMLHPPDWSCIDLPEQLPASMLRLTHQQRILAISADLHARRVCHSLQRNLARRDRRQLAVG